MTRQKTRAHAKTSHICLSMQMVLERIKAFDFNGQIMAEFEVGYANFLRGAAHLIPARSVLMVLGAAILAGYVYSRYGSRG